MKKHLYKIVCVLMIGGLLAGVIAPIVLSFPSQTQNNEQIQDPGTPENSEETAG